MGGMPSNYGRHYKGGAGNPKQLENKEQEQILFHFRRISAGNRSNSLEKRETMVVLATKHIPWIYVVEHKVHKSGLVDI